MAGVNGERLDKWTSGKINAYQRWTNGPLPTGHVLGEDSKDREEVDAAIKTDRPCERLMNRTADRRIGRSMFGAHHF